MKNETKSALLGFLAGAAAGAITGILLAPDKGTNTRREISKTAKTVSKDVSGTFHDKVEELKEQVNRIVAEVLEKVKDMGDKVSKTGEKVTEAGQKMEKDADTVGNKTAATVDNAADKANEKIYGKSAGTNN